jgi:hypothetical protein
MNAGKTHISFLKGAFLLLLALMPVMTTIMVQGQGYALGSHHVSQHQDDFDADQRPDEDATILTLKCEAVLPVAHFHLPIDLYFILEVFVLNETHTKQVRDIPLIVNTFFKALFHHIISPNAP